MQGFPSGSSVTTMLEPQEMQVGSLGWVDPLEEDMAPHSSILAWRIPWPEEPGLGYSLGGHKESDMTDMHTAN